MKRLSKKALSAVGDRAVELFGQGWNCAESVFIAVTDAFGKKAPIRIITGFGGGLGHCRSTCGAISGGIAALGTKFGRTRPDKAAKERAYEKAAEFYKRFRRAFHTTNCWELTDCEQDSKKIKRICRKYVRRAAIIAADIMQE